MTDLGVIGIWIGLLLGLTLAALLFTWRFHVRVSKPEFMD